MSLNEWVAPAFLRSFISYTHNKTDFSDKFFLERELGDKSFNHSPLILFHVQWPISSTSIEASQYHLQTFQTIQQLNPSFNTTPHHLHCCPEGYAESLGWQFSSPIQTRGQIIQLMLAWAAFLCRLSPSYSYGKGVSL